MPNASDANPTICARHLLTGTVIVLPLISDDGGFEPARPEDVFIVLSAHVDEFDGVKTMLKDIHGKVTSIVFGGGEVITLKRYTFI